MIVRDFNELKTTDRAVSDARWTSTRMLLADDGMGFSFHITELEAGSEHTFHYKHHFESVYCMAGAGSITMYALNLNDKHTLRATEKLVMACCFNPPVTGTEVHREDGSYAPAETA